MTTQSRYRTDEEAGFAPFGSAAERFADEFFDQFGPRLRRYVVDQI